MGGPACHLVSSVTEVTARYRRKWWQEFALPKINQPGWAFARCRWSQGIGTWSLPSSFGCRMGQVIARSKFDVGRTQPGATSLIIEKGPLSPAARRLGRKRPEGQRYRDVAIPHRKSNGAAHASQLCTLRADAQQRSGRWRKELTCRRSVGRPRTDISEADLRKPARPFFRRVQAAAAATGPIAEAFEEGLD